MLRTLFLAPANALFALSGLGAWRRLRRAVRAPEQAQAAVLRGILAKNQDTAYGRAHGFADLSTPEAFVARVPPARWEDLAPYVERMAAGEADVLTAEPPRMFEPTSGSSAASKLVPYTASLLAEFQEALGAWLFDLYRSRPGLALGTSYWCVTPLAARQRRTTGGISIGFDEDAEYFGAFRQRLLSTLLVVPKEVALCAERDAFRYATLLFLLAAGDLSVISVWSPTFLTTLLDPLPDWLERLARDLERGTVDPPAPLDDGLRARLAARLGRHPRRAREVLQTLRLVTGTRSERTLTQQLWPRVRLLSAWADGAAAGHVDRLQALFPRAELQPKGLLATEGVVTIPISGCPDGGVLAANSHFFEFVDGAGVARFAHQLDVGATYRVRVTTGGGLYRYELGDRVLVRGSWGGLPLLRFVGREGAVVDHFGEKLNEDHVRSVVVEALGAVPPFALLALEDGPPPGYVLWLEGASRPPHDLALAVERGLAGNHHYDHCRRVGQLEELAVRVLPPGRGAQGLAARAAREGGREGTLKPALLDRRSGWVAWFVDG